MLQLVLPARELFAASEQGATSWIQVAKTGKFVSPVYGKFEITPAMLEEMVSNFNAVPRAHIDYDHLSTSEITTPEQGKAAGWFSKLETRSSGAELWGHVEWTPRASELIKNKEYRFISPTFQSSAKSKETGQPIGARLVCAAVTNTPFLDGMQPLTLSEVSMDEKQRRVSDAFNLKFNAGVMPAAYIVEFFEGYVIVRKYETGQLFRVDYTLGDDLKVEFTGEPQEVIQTYEPVTRPSGETQMVDNMNEITQLRESMTQLQSTVTSLRDTITSQNTQIATLTSTVQAAEAARVAAETKLAETVAVNAVEELIKSGKLLAKQRDWATNYAKKDPEGFKQFSEQLTPVRQLNTDHGSGAGTETVTQFTGTKGPNGEGLAELAFMDAIKKHQKNGNLSFDVAYQQVQLAEPALFQKYREELNGIVQ